MQIKLLIAFLILSSNLLYSQEVMSSNGEDGVGPTFHYTYTVGEPVIETGLADTSYLTQGFNQPFNNCIILPLVDAGNDLFVCQGDTLTLTASGADTYAWSNGITNNVTFTPDSTAYYTVSGTDNKNCTGLDSLLVTIQALPVMILDTVIDQGCEGVYIEYINSSDENLTAEWTFPDGSTTDEAIVIKNYNYRDPFEASLTITDSLGCSTRGMISGNLLGLEDYFQFIKPNVVTPNGDGQNDVFELGIPGKLYECTYYAIYNRWGQMIYQSSKKEPKWSGKNAAGLPVTNGTYFYKLVIPNEEVTGTINVFY